MVVLSLVRRQSLVLPRVAVARLHCSSSNWGKSKKSKNGPSNSRPSLINTDKVSAPNSIPSQSRPQGNESSPDAMASSADSTPPNQSETSSSPSSLASALRSTDPTQAITSSPSINPEDTNPINDEQYKAYRGKQSYGPFTWKAAVLFVLTGTGLVIYFRIEKERMDRLSIIFVLLR